jgi:hypothetical protein
MNKIEIKPRDTQFVQMTVQAKQSLCFIKHHTM